MKINFTSFRFRVGLMIVSVIGFIFFTTSQVQAIPVEVVGDVPRSISSMLQAVKDAIVKVGKVTFLNSLRSLVNQFAYDTATYLGSGGQGQKPVYFTQEFGPWLRDQAFNVGGQFIEEFAQTSEGEFIDKYNICSPDLTVTVKIGLGLTDFANKSGGLAESRCNLKKIYEEGRNSVDLYLKPGYLKNLAITAFEPESTDIGVATTIFDQFSEKIATEKESLQLGRLESNGWIPETTSIAKTLKSPPGNQEAKLEQARNLQTQNFFTQTGDIFVDAANIFLNQLALSAFNKLIDNLSRSNSQGSSGGSSSYYGQGNTGGMTEVSRRNSTILQARFNERTDYNILSELSSCPDENKPGPTNCVISEQFAQAVSEKITVAEAINRNIIDSKKRIGFNAQGGDLNYLDGYPYRSLIILRKYRILPVGWEVAAQYIKDNPAATKDITIGDLINCFAPNDSYVGLSEEWCQGLIDPNWVLKVPKQYCGMEGYGPEIVQDQLATSNVGYCTKKADANCDPRNKDTSGDCATNYVTCFNDSNCTNYPGFEECNLTVRQEHQIVRNNNYCADEQACIKENTNGSCAYYGYCTEEKRRWVFNQEEDNSCEPRNNTCQTFKNDTGKQASFLENTLDYSNCDANQVGCKQYALEGPYVETTKKITWDDTGNQAFFNKNASECDPTKENCHQFIRIKDGLDANLIADSSFEQSTCIDVGGTCELTNFTATLNNLPSPNNRWYILVNSGTVKAGIVNTKADTGSQSLYIEGNGSWFSQEVSDLVPLSSRYSVLPDTFVMEGGHYYTFSARVFVEQGTVFMGFGYLGAHHVESTVTNQWQTLRVTIYKPPVGGPWTNYFIGGRTPSTKFYVDDIKLTVGPATTDYSEYGENTTIYQKLLPKYLAATCYASGGREPYTLKDDAPDECKQFARQCNDSEVGCEAYTSLDSGLNITGKVTAPDYCPSSCVGYNTFVQQPNAFNPRQAFYFIPTTARSCSAQAVGCTTFTNLDKLDQGGEAIEYYSAMRKCIKPDPTKCLPFYTWEGSDESGFQLKVFSLQKDPGSRVGDEPLSTMPSAEETLLCNASIFTKLPTDPGYNYDCRQFYAQDGTISYHLLEKTITCSDDCHPYRRELTTAASCIAAGGDWDATQNRCLYYAIPGEGKQCAASDVGCSEFTGNIASNTRNVFNPSISTFEQVTTPPFDGWFSSDPLFRSNFSLNLGGHSLQGISMSKVVGADVQQNKSYNLTFLARSAVGVPTFIQKTELANETGDTADFGVTGTSIPMEWKLYSFNLSNLNHTVSPAPDGDNWTHTGEKLNLVFNDPVYIDNVKLTEIPNRHYLIRYSWTTPAECDQDFSGAASVGYMLGCSQYKKADNSRVNLRSFTDLCSDSSAGCESMIDTYNSDDYRKSVINDDNYNGTTDPTDNNGTCDPGELSCIETPKDNLINVIYDPSKQCGVENKGCQRVGGATTYDGLKTFSDVYIKNNPDRYNTTVCTAQGIGCSKWTSPDGDAYFKDPGEEVCEWRLTQGTVSNYDWYKKKVNRCGGSGILCSNDSQCGPGIACQLVTTDIPCDTTIHKTLSEGGQKIYQPSLWAGVCENTQAGCTELVDPVSTFNTSLIRNPSYQTSSGGSGPDFWDEIPDISGSPGGVAVQSTTLDLYTTYIIKGNDTCTYENGRGSCNPDDEVYIRDCTINNGTGGETAEIYQLDASDNLFHQITNGYAGTDVTSGSDRSLEFYVASSNPRGSNASSVSCSVWRKNRTSSKTIQLRQAVVGYQLRQNLDTQTPNGLASFNKGYILFNQRIQSGNKKIPLLFNADETGDGGTDGTTPKTRSRPWNANVIIKVKADRTCSKWLDCSSYIPDPTDPRKQTCLEVGLCDSLNSEGQCNHFIDPNTTKNQNINNLGDVGQISNLTGYSKVGYYRNLIGRGGTLYSTSLFADDYNLANMKQVGETIDLKNGDFEYAVESLDNDWIGNLNIIVQPQLVTTEGLKSLHPIKNRNAGNNGILPPSGAGVAKLNSGDSATHDTSLSFEPGKTYALSAYVYVKSGVGKIDLLNNGVSALTILKVDSGQDPTNQWVRKTGVFKIPPGTNFNIELKSEAGGEVYFDKIAIESALNIRCNNQDQTQITCTTQEYTASTCRLFPTEDALSCTHIDSSNTEHRGLKGYCLEYDPSSPGTCLLWYPLDKIASDQTEEGLGLTLPSQMFYCLETQAECLGSPSYSIVPPEFNSTSVPGYNVAANTNWTYSDFRPGTPQANRYYYNPNSGAIGGTGGPDKPSYTCTKVAEISSVDKKYWRTRLVDSSSYKIDQKAAQKIFFNDFAGNEVTTNYNASNYFGYFGAFNSSSLKKYIQASDLGLGGIPYISDHNLTCSAFLRIHQDAGDNCTVHERANMGFWETCGVVNEVTPTYGCDRCGYCPFDPLNSGISARVQKTVDGWIVEDQDAGETSGGTDYTQNRIQCSSNARVTYNGVKSTDPQKDLLASIFVETSNIYSRTGNTYTSGGANLSTPTNKCGTGGTTNYPSFCTGDPTKSCTSIANCVGKGTCFMRRTSITSSGQFNYATDYCYIPPTVYDFTINGLSNQLAVTDGSKEVTFVFKTKTDPDQQPLKHIDIDLDYKECPTCSSKVFSMPSGNYSDLLRNLKIVLQYSAINKPFNSTKCALANTTVGSTGISCGSKPCCVIKPKLTIEDNWGKCNSAGGPCGFSPTNGYIRVDQN